ncbi:type II toxin-antitoxin system HicB family antitoxin [Candidatus Acetothermia bacterium]|jgi:predicted RNase H-like HicB family nuclease|nr:type II toxin-antitoxin system HicB family antitoxin [Candidatus Acetothermia bacterium]
MKVAMKRANVLKKPKRSYIFRVVIEPDEDVYHAYCPALKGCHSWGYTYEEALQNIQEAVQCHVETLLQTGDLIPTEPAGDVEVKPAPIIAINV